MKAMQRGTIAGTPAGKLAWRSPKKDSLVTGTMRRIWLSRDGLYQIEERAHGSRGRRYLALAAPAPESYWEILSRHRTRPAAIAACERHARRRSKALCLSTQRL